MKEKKDKITAGVVTIIFHALLIILLAFLTLSAAEIDEDREDGVPVMLGIVEDAGGMDNGGLPAESVAEAETDEADEAEEAEETEVPPVPVAPAPQPAPKAEPKPAPQPTSKPAAKPLITQEDERSIAAEEARKKAAEEAARKKAAEDAARAAANNRVAGAFGSGGKAGNSGNTTGDGAQGSPDGNSNAGKPAGNGGLGTGLTASVSNRTVVYLAKPNYADQQSEGVVVVSIKVSEGGTVVSASIMSSTTSSAALKNAALSAAKQSRFSEGDKVESGSITYRFKLR